MEQRREGGFLIGMIHRMAGRILYRKLKRYDVEINPAQGRIMFVLWREDGIPIQELARRTSLGKSTLTSMLDRLEKTGHIRRRPSKEDRRVVRVHRTKKDHAYQQKYDRVSREMTDLFYRGFKKSEIEGFENYLRRILQNLTEHEARQNGEA